MERHRNEKLRGGAFGFLFFAALATNILTFHAPSPLTLAGLAGLAILLAVAAFFSAVSIAAPILRAYLA